ncbi:hypothetical protein [Pseudonocardia acidicola]|uniref:Uncharacterized protein n=1 Tax=Pseudonocardia acidicola TaxID=2724939 RepID=A0ABX1S3R0_9PSEU|nr:hypothetical protein [Pseudonocardia acidicola]NMH96161.1 hypothetical protein [Pseudonocardia acidicola]
MRNGVGRARCGHSGVNADAPLWARIRLDATSLETLDRLTYTIARTFAPESAAREFSRVTSEVAADAIGRGGGTWDLWQDPDSLICQVVLGDPDPADGPRHRPGADGRSTAGPGPWWRYDATHRIDVCPSPTKRAVRLSIDGPVVHRR